MALSRFDHNVAWDEFTEVQARPQGETEDASIFIRAIPFNWATRAGRGGCRVTRVTLTIRVRPNQSWVVRGRQSATLLNHEQGHFDISALGFREMYNRILALTRPKCRDIDRPAGQIQQEVQQQIDAANIRYDEQTSHGTDAAVQQTWDTAIGNAKSNANGTVADLPA
jgi:predicted secreted Zn-dependent protease